jgi:hypothetical protein
VRRFGVTERGGDIVIYTDETLDDKIVNRLRSRAARLGRQVVFEPEAAFDLEHGKSGPPTRIRIWFD